MACLTMMNITMRQYDAGRRGLVVLCWLGGVDDREWPSDGSARGSSLSLARASAWSMSTLGVVDTSAS
jgi:hypothetical protein